VNKPVREGFVAVDEPVETQVPESTPASPPEPAEVWPLVIKLMHKPVQKSAVATDTVNELVFREPTAGDIVRSGGNPVRVEVAQVTGNEVIYNFIIDDVKMMRLMANLCGVLEPFLQKMDSRDYNSCAHRLRRFFIAEQGMW
jgi:Phage tail assembly chaperone proteins, E, or 41 or 14